MEADSLAARKRLEQWAAGAEGAALAAFGMVEDTCGAGPLRDERRDRLARAIHAHFTQRREATTPRKSANDPALRPWEDLTEDVRESNRQQADHIEIKLRATGCELVEAADPRAAVAQFSLAEIEALAELEHQRWNAERWLSGRRYGVPTHKLRRISEYLVSWSEMHISIQKDDREAVGDIPELVKLSTPPQKVVRRGPPN